jgi:hypothetical protein
VIEDLISVELAAIAGGPLFRAARAFGLHEQLLPILHGDDVVAVLGRER